MVFADIKSIPFRPAEVTRFSPKNKGFFGMSWWRRRHVFRSPGERAAHPIPNRGQEQSKKSDFGPVTVARAGSEIPNSVFPAGSRPATVSFPAAPICRLPRLAANLQASCMPVLADAVGHAAMTTWLKASCV